MSELISWKEALMHVAECTVQYQHPDEPKEGYGLGNLNEG